MSKSFMAALLLVSFSLYAKTDTENYIVKSLRYDTDKKRYDVILSNQDGIFTSEDKYYKCLEKSLMDKKSAKITYNLSNLKITDCSNLP